MTIRPMIETKLIRDNCDRIAISIARDHHIAQDITQETYLEMLEHMAEYDDRVDTPEDFYKEFRRLAYNAYRRLMRVLQKEVVYEDKTAVYNGIAIDFDSIISSLKPRLQTVARLYRDGYTVAEIADKLCISRAYANTLRNDCIAKLRRQLCYT